MLELHSAGLGGHFGRDKTLEMVIARFFWPKMYRDVKQVVKRCRNCQLGKDSTQNIGLYTSLSEPDMPWIHISMD